MTEELWLSLTRNSFFPILWYIEWLNLVSITDRTFPKRDYTGSLTITGCYLQPSLAEAPCTYNFFSIRYRPHTPRGASWGGVIYCHRMAHYVLIRCYLQPSLTEAPWWWCIYQLSIIKSIIIFYFKWKTCGGISRKWWTDLINSGILFTFVE